MKYTKDNIIGIQFQCFRFDGSLLSDPIYTIEKNLVKWGSGSYSSYDMGVMAKFLNERTWRPINLEPKYEIY